jgi:hypothetical protein
MSHNCCCFPALLLNLPRKVADYFVSRKQLWMTGCFLHEICARYCDNYGVFDAVDLYPHLQNLTEMRPVVVNPSISLEQLFEEFTRVEQEEHRTLNVLFADNTGTALRKWLMELCDLHTLLRLPTGIFYAQGVKTNVLFFTRGKTDRGNTKGVWVYDMRANMPAFGKTHPLTVKDFEEFERAFGDDPLGKAKRKDEGETGRFRYFSREQIAARNDSLDIAWLKDTSADPEDEMTEPDELAAAITGHLKAALEEIEALSEELPSEETQEAA